MKLLKSKFIRLSPSERLYQLDKPLIGLTGGIATGKSTVTKLLQSRGLQITDADQLVKNIYEHNETKNFIRTHYPEVWENEKIDFSKLRELFFKSSTVKENIEKFIYTRLPASFEAASKLITDQNFYIYDVPLLFEKNLNTKVDLSIVVYAPYEIQLERLIKRDGTKEDTGKKILEQQLNIDDKKNQADFIINNSGSKTELAAQVDNLLLQILE